MVHVVVWEKLGVNKQIDLGGDLREDAEVHWGYGELIGLEYSVRDPLPVLPGRSWSRLLAPSCQPRPRLVALGGQGQDACEAPGPGGDFQCRVQLS